MSQNRRSGASPITPNMTLDQTQTAMRSLVTVIKDANEAKTHLMDKNWLLPGESPTLETLARTLFAVIADNSKLPSKAANPILAVAYLITERLETDKRLDITKSITKHLLDAFVPIAADFETKLQNHLNVITESTKAHAEISDQIQITQDKLEETSEKIKTNAKSYSQVASTPSQPPPVTSYSQIQIRNREEIKRRQVLVNFVRAADLELDYLDEHMLSRKAVESLNTTWVAAPEPKPAIPKLKAATLLRNGGLLLELDTADAADWLREETPRDSFLANMGSGAKIKDRTYQVILQFVLVQFKPDETDHLRQLEAFNDLPESSILKAEWIKPIKNRKATQKVATMRLYFKDANSANAILKGGASIFNKRTVPKKPKREPIRCLRCQCFGHERRDCQGVTPRCAICADRHETDDCIADPNHPKCSNCRDHHPSFDRECPMFREKCRQIDGRCPENKLAFYPTNATWTWVTMENAPNANADPPPPHNRDHHPSGHYAPLSGTNNTPLGHPRPNNRQSYSPSSPQ